MSNYQSYSTYQAPVEEVPYISSPAINADAGRTTSVVIRDGVSTVEQTSSQRVLSSELNPHHGDGSVFATAQAMRGMHVSEITPDTLLTINGVQAPASFFEAQGFIHRAADGSYTEGAGDGQQVPTDTPKRDTSADQLAMPNEVVAQVDRALEGVADEHLAPLVGVGIGVATGEIDRSSLEWRMVDFAGVSPQEAAARVSAVGAAYQAQADVAITSRCGISEGDLSAFYQWAKETQRGTVRDAITAQVYQSDLSGWRGLADRYLRENPPSLEAVKAGGYETRQHGDKAEVLMDGRWMTIQTAARLGFL